MTDEPSESPSPKPRSPWRLSFREGMIVASCTAGLACLGCAGFIVWHDLAIERDLMAEAMLLYLFAVIFLTAFVIQMARFYKNEPSLRRRGFFSLFISMVIILLEIIFKLLGAIGPFEIIILDFITGYVFLRARKIVIPMASLIIEAYEGRDMARRRLGFLIMFFGILFIYLQAAAIYAFLQTEKTIMYILLAFALLQLFSAYWGYILTRLGHAIYNGFEPEFAQRARTRLEKLEKLLRRRREGALVLENKTVEERNTVFRQAAAALNQEEAKRVFARMNFSFLVTGVICAGFVAGGIGLLRARNLWGGLLILCIGLILVWASIKAYRTARLHARRNFLEFTHAGIRMVMQHSEKDRIEISFLWVEFLKIKGLTRVALDSEGTTLEGYDRGLILNFKPDQYRLNQINEQVRKFLDAPELLTADMDLMPVEDLRFGRNTPGGMNYWHLVGLGATAPEEPEDGDSAPHGP